MTGHEMNLHHGERASSQLQIATHNQERFAAGLALIAGYVDAYAIVRYKTYVSFMSGNTTQLGSLVGQDNFAAAIPSLLAVVCFVIGVFSGALIAYSGSRQTHRLVFGWVAVLLAGTIAVTQMNALASDICIAMLSLAMGLMNTELSHIGAQSVNLVFVTGTLYSMANHLAQMVKRAPLSEAQGPWDTHRRRAFLLLGLWASFLTGAFLGGLVTAHLGEWNLLFPALILTALAVLNDVPA